MSRDHRTLRAFVVLLGIVGSSVSTGCLRSPMLRPADGPVPRDAASTDRLPSDQPAAPAGPGPQVAADSGNQAVIPTASAVNTSPAVSAASASFELQSAPTPLHAQAVELLTAPPQAPAASPRETQPAQAPDARTTPLLDAAFERVRVIRQHQSESPDPEAPPGEPDRKPPTLVAPAIPVAVAALPQVKKPEPILPIDTHESVALVAPRLLNQDDLIPQPARQPGPTEDVPRTLADPASKPDPIPRAGSADSAKEKPEAPAQPPPFIGDIRPTVAPTDDPDPLGIGKLRLCRKVHGFGSFEALGESDVKAGQRMLVYCEMTGMRYEAKETSFVSRLSSKIEISSAGDGAVQWKQELGPAKDVCGSRRHDFYVIYRVDLPKTLATGPYRLRLTQTDLVANRTTSTELPFLIVP